MKQKTWFITGASKGFGKVWANAALERGDKVVATARKVEQLNDLKEKFTDNILCLTLDVNNRDDCFNAVNTATNHFGGIDILVSNAGYGHFGYTEELTEKEVRDQFETNVFGSIWVIQAVLPIMRKQKSGHIFQVSSIGGVMAFASVSIYNASKFAMEGFCDALSQEVASFGIKVTLIEPASYSTDWGTTSATRSKAISEYDNAKAEFMSKMPRNMMQPGDPNATAKAILKLADSENPPLRFFMGKFPFMVIGNLYQQRLKEWNDWQKDSEEAQG